MHGFGLNRLKQFKTANSNRAWAYILDDLLSEGYLRLRIGGIIFGWAYFLGSLLSEFYGSFLCNYVIMRGLPEWGKHLSVSRYHVDGMRHYNFFD